MSTNSRTIANLAVADRVDDIDAIRHALRTTELEIRASASMIRDVPTRDNIRTYGFVLDHPAYRDWLLAAGSATLGIVGSAATGKTIVSGLIYDDLLAHTSARGSDKDVCIFYRCSPAKTATPAAILKAMVWSIFDRRPDLATLAVVGKDDKWWAARIRDAQDRVPALWNLFAKLAGSVGTVWLVLDSVHDCDDSVQGLLRQLVRASGRTSMTVKIAATSRSPARFTEANIDNWVAYTAADLEGGVEAYVRARLAQMDVVRWTASGSSPAVVAATRRMGGGHFWARAVLNQLQHKKSTETALRALERLVNPVQLGDNLLSRLTRDDDSADFALCVYGVVVESPATCSVADIQAAISSSYPRATRAEILDVLDSRLQGLFAALNGDYVWVTNAIKACQHQTVRALRVKAAAAERRVHEEVAAMKSRRQDEIAELERRARSRAWLEVVMVALVVVVLGLILGRILW
ncbi:hypothetical protein PG997_010211 [Apiospora hydei]|uniref:Nephrocystin 3-like N-terminal domain-containing protein n=1 Tax=Apiospora hydei TaxID=1337664 RepID=A0ABR1VWC9_9PEZI